MKNLSTALLVVFSVGSSFFAQAQNLSFSVLHKGKTIGTIKGSTTKTGTITTHQVKTVSDTKVMFVSVHIESELTVVFNNSMLQKGTAYRSSNRSASDVHASTYRLPNGNYEIERNGKKTILTQPITRCVADLYFQEPVNWNSIYSNMLGAFATIKNTGKGTYVLTTPDNKTATYTYQSGKLYTIETETPIGKITVKAIG